jgi:hypothetical protein
LLLALTALQQSCGTNPAPPSPKSEPARVERTEPTSEEITEFKPQPVRPKQAAGKFSRLLIEPRHRGNLPESLLGAPERDPVSPEVTYATVLLDRSADTPLFLGWQYRKDPQEKIVGFEFSNRGGNRIIPHRYDIEKNLFFSRDFQFRFDDRARQNIHLFVTDWAPSRDRQFRLSELMHSIMHFFPRNYLPAIYSVGARTIVTLPTGEEVEFNAETHEILGGAFSETPVDLNPDKTSRKFAGIHYNGRGLVVRANARGVDPRLGTTATITTGSKGVQCQVPSREMWEQNGAVRFRFPTDEEFDRYLLSRCGFGLPQNGPQFMTASVSD